MHTEKAFLLLINENKNIIHRVCNLYMNNGQDRKDLFQDILLAAWKGFKNFKGDAKFSTWLYRVALNTATTFYRKARRQPETSPWPADLPETADPTDPYNEQMTAMYQSINQLSGIDKALVMLFIEDYSYQEMADMMGITANHVAVKMNRIKAKLRAHTKQAGIN